MEHEPTITVHRTDNKGTADQLDEDFKGRRPLLFDPWDDSLYVGGPAQYHKEAIADHGIEGKAHTMSRGCWMPGANAWGHDPGTVLWFDSRVKPQWQDAIARTLNAEPDGGFDFEQFGSPEAPQSPAEGTRASRRTNPPTEHVEGLRTAQSVPEIVGEYKPSPERTPFIYMDDRILIGQPGQHHAEVRRDHGYPLYLSPDDRVGREGNITSEGIEWVWGGPDHVLHALSQRTGVPVAAPGFNFESGCHFHPNRTAAVGMLCEACAGRRSHAWRVIETPGREEIWEDASERPILIDHNAKTLYLGGLGQAHEGVYREAGLPFLSCEHAAINPQTGRYDGFSNLMGVNDAASIDAILRAHLGIDVKRDDTFDFEHFASTQGWQPGSWGKFLITPEDEVHHWSVGQSEHEEFPADGHPHHIEYVTEHLPERRDEYNHDVEYGDAWTPGWITPQGELSTLADPLHRAKLPLVRRALPDTQDEQGLDFERFACAPYRVIDSDFDARNTYLPQYLNESTHRPFLVKGPNIYLGPVGSHHQDMRSYHLNGEDEDAQGWVDDGEVTAFDGYDSFAHPAHLIGEAVADHTGARYVPGNPFDFERTSASRDAGGDKVRSCERAAYYVEPIKPGEPEPGDTYNDEVGGWGKGFADSSGAVHEWHTELPEVGMGPHHMEMEGPRSGVFDPVDYWIIHPDGTRDRDVYQQDNEDFDFESYGHKTWQSAYGGDYDFEDDEPYELGKWAYMEGMPVRHWQDDEAAEEPVSDEELWERFPGTQTQGGVLPHWEMLRDMAMNHPQPVATDFEWGIDRDATMAKALQGKRYAIGVRTQDGAMVYAASPDVTHEELERHLGMPVAWDGRDMGEDAPYGESLQRAVRGEHSASRLTDLVRESIDYGELYVNDDERRVFIIMGDADEGDLIDAVREQAARDHPGYEIECEAEVAAPKGEGWRRVASGMHESGFRGHNLVPGRSVKDTLAEQWANIDRDRSYWHGVDLYPRTAAWPFKRKPEHRDAYDYPDFEKPAPQNEMYIRGVITPDATVHSWDTNETGEYHHDWFQRTGTPPESVVSWRTTPGTGEVEIDQNPQSAWPHVRDHIRERWGIEPTPMNHTTARTAGNQVWWKPGEHGRGFIQQSDRTVHTWPEDEGSHMEMAEAKRIPWEDVRRSSFSIQPNGMTRWYYMPPLDYESLWPHVQAADPRLSLRGSVEPDTTPPASPNTTAHVDTRTATKPHIPSEDQSLHASSLQLIEPHTARHASGTPRDELASFLRGQQRTSQATSYESRAIPLPNTSRPLEGLIAPGVMDGPDLFGSSEQTEALTCPMCGWRGVAKLGVCPVCGFAPDLEPGPLSYMDGLSTQAGALAGNRPSCKEFLTSKSIREAFEILDSKIGGEGLSIISDFDKPYWETHDTLPPWEPGMDGKGLVLSDGSAHTWGIDPRTNGPHHGEARQVIDPEGGTTTRHYLHVYPDGRVQAEGNADLSQYKLDPRLKPIGRSFDFFAAAEPRFTPDYEYGEEPYAWEPGMKGKGFVLQGRPYSWATDRFSSPHHPDVAAYLDPSEGSSPEGYFHIHPDGGVEAEGQAGQGMIDKFCAHHPDLHPADPYRFDFEESRHSSVERDPSENLDALFSGELYYKEAWNSDERGLPRQSEPYKPGSWGSILLRHDGDGVAWHVPEDEDGEIDGDRYVHHNEMINHMGRGPWIDASRGSVSPDGYVQWYGPPDFDPEPGLQRLGLGQYSRQPGFDFERSGRRAAYPITVVEHPQGEDDWISGGYLGRRPLLYDDGYKHLHVGEDDETHYDLLRRATERGYTLRNPQEGWMGPNPERDSTWNSDWQNEGTPHEYGWYSGSPGPEVDEALRRHFDAKPADEGFDFERFAALPPLRVNEYRDAPGFLGDDLIEMHGQSRPVIYHTLRNQLTVGGVGHSHGDLMDAMGYGRDNFQVDRARLYGDTLEWYGASDRARGHEPEIVEALHPYGVRHAIDGSWHSGDYPSFDFEDARGPHEAGLPRGDDGLEQVGLRGGGLRNAGGGGVGADEGFEHVHGLRITGEQAAQQRVDREIRVVADHAGTEDAGDGAVLGTDDDVIPALRDRAVIEGALHDGAVVQGGVALDGLDRSRDIGQAAVGRAGQGSDGVGEASDIHAGILAQPATGRQLHRGGIDLELTHDDGDGTVKLDRPTVLGDDDGVLSGVRDEPLGDRSLHDVDRLDALGVGEGGYDRGGLTLGRVLEDAVGVGGSGHPPITQKNGAKIGDANLEPRVVDYSHINVNTYPGDPWAGRRAILYHPMTNSIHVGPLGGTHGDVASAALKSGYPLKSIFNRHSTDLYQGWVGFNPEAGSAPWQDEGNAQYGWYGPTPGPHVDAALGKHFDAQRDDGSFDFERLGAITSAPPEIDQPHPLVYWPHQAEVRIGSPDQHHEEVEMFGPGSGGHRAIVRPGAVDWLYDAPPEDHRDVAEALTHHYGQPFESTNDLDFERFGSVDEGAHRDGSHDGEQDEEDAVEVAGVLPDVRAGERDERKLHEADQTEGEGESSDHSTYRVADDGGFDDKDPESDAGWYQHLDGINQLEPWSLGSDGKGLLHHDGTLTTWTDRNIHHQEVEANLRAQGKRTMAQLDHIAPDGTTMLDTDKYPGAEEILREKGLRPVGWNDDALFDFNDYGTMGDEYVGLNG